MPGRRPVRTALCAALAALTLAAATACGDDSATVQGAHLVRKGALTTCTHLPYPPFQSEQGGKIVGFDVDLIDLVAKKLGVKQKIVDTPFETIKTGSALNAGKCDLAAAGMTIRPDRARFITFSAPYFTATQALMGKKGQRYGTLAEVKDAGVKVGSQASTTGEEYARSQKVDTVSFKDSASLLNGLRTGRVDVIIEDYPVIQGWLKDPANAAYALDGNFDTGEKYGFAVRKDQNPGLVTIINQVIATARADGSYKRIYEKWIGPMPAGS
ncbi:ABC transporter substrate-binding protein [Actinomadura rayongensis]|uniref:Transporter substrate-binding domain-containing protein n=1 Tax=Actinomadura rayongensis TaxID=1429076 RepID=A0A6I4W0T3_9ACTN|nr:ABC transporter substrate-binding protein [Actinomadura rayongensis]MXQ63857.1 transporter substrate-binding domain-containing protein [Actinomadura rayongensis]